MPEFNYYNSPEYHLSHACIISLLDLVASHSLTRSENELVLFQFSILVLVVFSHETSFNFCHSYFASQKQVLVLVIQLFCISERSFRYSWACTLDLVLVLIIIIQENKNILHLKQAFVHILSTVMHHSQNGTHYHILKQYLVQLQ